MSLLYAAIIIFIINIPFGYWRESVRKFSLQWILAIHLPVPVVIALRFIMSLGFRFITYPVLVGAFFLGQYAAAKIYSRRKRLTKLRLTSCLICDIVLLIKDSFN